MPSSNKFSASDQKGFAPIFLLIAVFGIAAVIAVSGLQAATPNYNPPNVKGASLAKGDNVSGGSATDEKSSETPEHQPKETEHDKEKPEVKNNDQGTEKKVEAEKKTEVEKSVETEVGKIEKGEVRFQNENGKLQIQVQNASGSAAAVAQNLAALAKGQNIQNLSLKLGKNGSEITIKTEDGRLKVESEGEDAVSNFPLSVDQSTGQLQVTTPNGVRTIRILPKQAAQVAQTAGVQNLIQNMQLDQNSNQNSQDKMVFKVQGVKTGSLFGLIPISMPVESEIGAETGDIVNVNQPLILTLLGRFIR